MKRLAILFLILASRLICVGQVNLQSGSATYSLPVFNWSDDRSNLNAIVNLDYNSGNGLRTNQVATCVGEGWNLVAGGAITRMQAGLPDDQYPRAGNGSVGDVSRYPAGYLFATGNPADGCPDVMNQYPIFKNRNVLYASNNNVDADRELDYFSFIFNGRTGLFILDKNTNKGITLGDCKLKISFTLNTNMSYGSVGIRTAISSFNIQDENGLIYKFATLSLSKTLKMSYTDPSCTGQLTQPTFEGGKVYHQSGFEDPSIVKPYVVDGWYLTEVEDALTHRKLLFTYETHSINMKAGTSLAYYQDKDYGVITHDVSKAVTPVISTISFPDGHYVNFNYGKERADFVGTKALASIDVTYQGRFLSKSVLNTTYFILNRYGNPVSDYQKKMARLCLQSVTQYGVDLKSFSEPYTFDYYTGSSEPDDLVPPPFSLIKDIWGFYNGTNSQDLDGTTLNPLLPSINLAQLKGLCYLRSATANNVTLNPKNGYAKNGLLKQIRFPSGGNIIYEYDQNIATIGNATSSNFVGGVHVYRTKTVDGGYSNNCDNPLITNYTYTKSLTGSESSLWGIEDPMNMVSNSSYYNPESKYWTWKGGLLGTCRYRYKYPGIIHVEQAFNLNIGQQLVVVFQEVMSALSTVLAVIRVVQAICTSTVYGAIITIIIEIIIGVWSLVASCKKDHHKDSNTNIFYNFDLVAANTLAAQFSRVMVTQGDGSSGSTVSTFTNPFTGDNPYPLWDPIGSNPLFSRKQRFAFWAYGLPERVTLYDASLNPVKETRNVYDYSKTKRALEATPGTPDYPSCKCTVMKSVSKGDKWWFNPTLNPTNFIKTNVANADIRAEIYGMYSGRVELADVYERSYKQGSTTQYLEKHTHLSYNSNNLQVNHMEITQSDGQVNITDLTFSSDYTTGVLAQLSAANILAAPVSKVSSIKKISEEYIYKHILEETAVEYTLLSNGSIKPMRNLLKRTDRPVISTSWVGYASPTASNTSFKEVQSFTYDNNGNTIEVVDEGGRSVKSLYDYHDKFLVASVANNNATPIAYTSFETDKLNGWTITGATTYSTNAITGSRGLVLGSGTSLTAPTGTNTSRLTFWANTANVTVTGNVLQKTTGPVRNGFTFYEYEVYPSTPGAAEVTITGLNGSIDEVRLYSLDARMRTVTYDPIIGKTSECDENNRITYFEYDDLARLRIIKDDQNNIVKMYEFSVLKHPCSILYSNNLIKEIFTRNNCAPGEVGGDWEYIVPAGTYTSYNSQYEADLMAQNELDKHGQEDANTYAPCSTLYCNDEMTSGDRESGGLGIVPETCPVGFTSLPIIYTVPAGLYCSIISKAEANQWAMDDINANGLSYANIYAIENNTCTIVIRDPIYEAEDGAATQCISGKLWVEVTDINPNSPTYNQTSWQETDEDCP